MPTMIQISIGGVSVIFVSLAAACVMSRSPFGVYEILTLGWLDQDCAIYSIFLNCKCLILWWFTLEVAKKVIRLGLQICIKSVTCSR